MSNTTSSADSQTKLIAGLVAIGAVILLAIGAFVRVSSAEGTSWHGTALEDPLPRPEFTLTDTEGQPFDFAAETEGRLTLLFFGFTNCPDICPGHMGVLQGVKDTPGVPDPLVVFVTTDPERDTPERLREWLDGFDEDFVGLTGTPEEIAAAEAAAEVAGSIRTTDDDGDPEVGHDARIVAYTPDDRAHVVYEFGTRREDWIADLPRLLEEYPS
jgi:protein SCO1